MSYNHWGIKLSFKFEFVQEWYAWVINIATLLLLHIRKLSLFCTSVHPQNPGPCSSMSHSTFHSVLAAWRGTQSVVPLPLGSENDSILSHCPDYIQSISTISEFNLFSTCYEILDPGTGLLYLLAPVLVTTSDTHYPLYGTLEDPDSVEVMSGGSQWGLPTQWLRDICGCSCFSMHQCMCQSVLTEPL